MRGLGFGGREAAYIDDIESATQNEKLGSASKSTLIYTSTASHLLPSFD
jgi:hypothetical protein